VPELDVPGHEFSWCAGYPSLCPSQSCLGPLDPSNPFTFEFIGNLIKEFASLFPERYIHLGGDEVDTSCWSNTPRIADWLKSNN